MLHNLYQLIKLVVKALSLALLASISISVHAQLALPNLFSNNMVLQRNTTVTIWGTDSPEQPITISASWGEQAKTITNKHGAWSVKLKTIKAGGPHSIKVNGSSSINLENILLGEVWLASGQSNMEMPLQGYNNEPVIDGLNAAKLSVNRQIRFFNIKRTLANEKQSDVDGQWLLPSSINSKKFSAVAYFFAEKLESNLNVPIAIISASAGGTPIEAWTAKEALTTTYRNAVNYIKKHTPWYKGLPSALYNAMIHPVAPYNIKGVIWYQGESNLENSAQYVQQYPALVNSWRKLWQAEKMPFYAVQVAPIGWGGEQQAQLRLAQTLAANALENSEIITTLDLGEKQNIHPARKKEVGNRLALTALAKNYHVKGLSYRGPQYHAIKKVGNKLNVIFHHAQHGLTSFGKPLTGFTVAGYNNKFLPAQAEIINGELFVWNSKIKNPIAVRYAWSDWVDASLFNSTGLPAAQFNSSN